MAISKAVSNLKIRVQKQDFNLTEGKKMKKEDIEKQTIILKGGEPVAVKSINVINGRVKKTFFTRQLCFLHHGYDWKMTASGKRFTFCDSQGQILSLTLKEAFESPRFQRENI